MHTKRKIDEVELGGGSSYGVKGTKRARNHPPTFDQPGRSSYKKQHSSTSSTPTLVNHSSPSLSSSRNVSDSNDAHSVSSSATSATSDSDLQSSSSSGAEPESESESESESGSSSSSSSDESDGDPGLGFLRPAPYAVKAMTASASSTDDESETSDSASISKSYAGTLSEINTESSSEDEDTSDSSSSSDEPNPPISYPVKSTPTGILNTSSLSKLKEKLDALLPILQSAKEELDIAEKEGRLGERNIENVEQGQEHIEMNLGLGVLEQKSNKIANEEASDDQSATSSSEDSSGDSSDEVSVQEISPEKFKDDSMKKLLAKNLLLKSLKKEDKKMDIKEKGRQSGLVKKGAPKKKIVQVISDSSESSGGDESEKAQVLKALALKKTKESAKKNKEGIVKNLLKAPKRKVGKKAGIVEVDDN